jgi:hypothetical protein
VKKSNQTLVFLIFSVVYIASYRHATANSLKTHCFNTDSVEYCFHTRNSIEENEVHQYKGIVKKYANKLHDYFDHKPEGVVHLIFNSLDETANGTAFVFPYNYIILNSEKPRKNSYLYSDSTKWRDILFVHEYTHILTMDMTHGMIEALRYVFGSSVKVNGLLPRWMLEGVAVWAESYFVEGGRATDNKLREDLSHIYSLSNICDDVSCIDEVNHKPYGSLSYWMGGVFFYDIEKKKPGTMRCLFQNHSDQVPFFMGVTFKNCVGVDLGYAYQKFISRYRGKSKCRLGKLCDFS